MRWTPIPVSIILRSVNAPLPQTPHPVPATVQAALQLTARSMRLCLEHVCAGSLQKLAPTACLQGQ